MDNNMNEYGSGGGHNNNRGGGQGGGGGGGQNPKKPNIMMLLLAGITTFLIVLMFWNLLFGNDNSTEEVAYTVFIQMLENGEIDEANLQSTGRVIFTRKEDASTPSMDAPDAYSPFFQRTRRVYSAFLLEDTTTFTSRLEAAGVKGSLIPSNNSSRILEFLGYVILPVALMWVLLSLLFRRMSGGGGPMGVGKSNAKVYVQKETGVTFKDVAGEDEAKESLVEVVDFLHDPGRFTKIGARLPKGALLVGPPGTGKTLLAKAVAGEAHVPFFSLTGSDFIELYVGVGASRVRDLFKEATKNAPCIIFIDEIDAIGRSRDSKYGGGNEEREQTLNQLLSEMDGFDSSKGILILGATNRPEILDKALLRPGRFDRRIIVDKPDLRGRVEILRVHAKGVKMDETVDLDAIALATSGAVGSDLANMINEAAINAVKEGRSYVNQHDLFTAVEQVLVGKEKKDRIMSKEERRIVSYHEVGHALVSALQKNSEPVQKITIVPRTMGALGYVMHVPEEEKYLNTEAELREMLISLVAGRAAEELVFDTVTTGAANDIEKATGIARSMITQYGMSKKFGLMGLATVESKYLEGRLSLNCSENTAAEVDAEVVDLLKESYDKSINLLRENRALMDKLAEYLIEKETITGKEFMEIFRKEKGLPEPEPKKGHLDKKEESKGGEKHTEDAPQKIDIMVGEEIEIRKQASSESESKPESSVEGTLVESTEPETTEERTLEESTEPETTEEGTLEESTEPETSIEGTLEESDSEREVSLKDSSRESESKSEVSEEETSEEERSESNAPVGKFSNRRLR